MTIEAQRFWPILGVGQREGSRPVMVTDDTGGWVEYEMHMEVVAELRAEVERLRSKLDRITAAWPLIDHAYRSAMGDFDECLDLGAVHAAVEEMAAVLSIDNAADSMVAPPTHDIRSERWAGYDEATAAYREGRAEVDDAE